MKNDKLNTPPAPPVLPAPIAMSGQPANGKPKEPKPGARPENSTDATQGEALAVRARARKAELEALLAKVPAPDDEVRADVERALSSVKTLLTGDTAHLSPTTAAELNRWLEGAKHLGEQTTSKPASKPGH
jgi:hypothetical protein